MIVSDADRGVGLAIFKAVPRNQVDPDRPADVQAPAGMGWGELQGLAAGGDSTLYAVALDNTPAAGLTIPEGGQNAPQMYTLRTDAGGEAADHAAAPLHDARATSRTACCATWPSTRPPPAVGGSRRTARSAPAGACRRCSRSPTTALSSAS